jgi:hypothetical protein
MGLWLPAYQVDLQHFTIKGRISQPFYRRKT